MGRQNRKDKSQSRQESELQSQLKSKKNELASLKKQNLQPPSEDLSTQISKKQSSNRAGKPPSGLPPVPAVVPNQFEFINRDRNQNLTQKYAHKGLGHLLLILSVLGGSSMGVMSNEVRAKGPFLKNAWRFQALLFVMIFMVPFYFLYDRYYLRYERYRAYIREVEAGTFVKKSEIQKEDQEGEDSSKKMSQPRRTTYDEFKQLDSENFRKTMNQTLQSFDKSVNLATQTNLAMFNLTKKIGKRTFIKNIYNITFLAAIFYCAWTSIQLWGSLTIVQSHSYALSNLHGVLIIPLMVLFRVETHSYEKLGSLVILFGVAFLLIDRTSVREDHLIPVPGKSYFKFKSTILMDLCMLGSNIFAALYFILNRSLFKGRILKHVIIMSVLITFIFSMLAVIFEDSSMNLNINNGLFGWLESQNAFQTIFLYGFCCTFLGTVGYILSMQFYSPLVCMNAQLLEPVVAQVIGCAMGYDRVPNVLTILGILMITGATVMINRGTTIMVRNSRRVFSDQEDLGSNKSIGLFSDQLKGDGGDNDDDKIRKHIEKMEERVRQLRKNADSMNKSLENKNLLTNSNNNSEMLAGLQGSKNSVNHMGSIKSGEQQTFSRILNPSLYNQSEIVEQ